MRLLFLFILLLAAKIVQAHNPDISSLMIYEQNGKSILLLKSSLTAFEGEIDCHYNKDAYKTPEEFNQLVIKHFLKKNFVVVNKDTLRFANIQVQLGHETTLFAELVGVPKNIKTYYVKSRFFQDMPNNVCELILTPKDLPQKQFILSNDNNQEVRLKAINGNWVIEKEAKPVTSSISLLWGGIALFIGIAAVIIFKDK